MLTRRILQVVALLAVLATPFAAQADGSVHAMLRGHVLDPYATTLKLSPPKGAIAMVYRDGKAVSWLSQPGYVGLQTDAVYSVLVTKGKRVLFNQSFIARHGTTSIEWSSAGSDPNVSFTPAYAPMYPPAHYGAGGVVVNIGNDITAGGYPQPAGYAGHGVHGHYGHRAHHQREAELSPPSVAPNGKKLSAKQFDRLRAHMSRMPTDKLRNNVLRPWTMRRVFSQAQSTSLLATYRTVNARNKATALLSPRTY